MWLLLHELCLFGVIGAPDQGPCNGFELWAFDQAFLYLMQVHAEQAKLFLTPGLRDAGKITAGGW